MKNPKPKLGKCKACNYEAEYKEKFQENWENSYPLNTFNGKTKEELIAFIAKEKDKSYKEGYADAIIDIDKLSKEMENAN